MRIALSGHIFFLAFATIFRQNSSDYTPRLPLTRLLKLADTAEREHVAPSWFKLVPIPSIKAKYYIQGPFQSPTAETPFKRRVAQASNNVKKGWEPLSTRVFEHYIYPLANATVYVNGNKTESVKVSIHKHA